jgi:hypothetical protein
MSDAVTSYMLVHNDLVTSYEGDRIKVRIGSYYKYGRYSRSNRKLVAFLLASTRDDDSCFS